MSKPPSAARSRSRSKKPSSEPYNREYAQLIVNLIEQGISLAPISRASGIPLPDLLALPVSRSTPVLDAEDLSRQSAALAVRALQEGMRILDEGDLTARVRLITSITGHPLRRMQTDQSQAMEQMRGLFDDIMSGGQTVEDAPLEEEVPTDGPAEAS